MLAIFWPLLQCCQSYVVSRSTAAPNVSQELLVDIDIQPLFNNGSNVNNTVYFPMTPVFVKRYNIDIVIS